MDYPFLLVALKQVVGVDACPEHPPECLGQRAVVVVYMVQQHRLVADCETVPGDLPHCCCQVFSHLLVVIDVSHEVDILLRPPVVHV